MRRYWITRFTPVAQAGDVLNELEQKYYDPAAASYEPPLVLPVSAERVLIIWQTWEHVWRKVEGINGTV